MVCPFISVFFFNYSRADKYSSTTISWVGQSGSMSGGYENAITVIITHLLWLAASCHCFCHHFIGTKSQWPKWGIYCHLLRWLGVMETPTSLGSEMPSLCFTSDMTLVGHWVFHSSVVSSLPCGIFPLILKQSIIYISTYQNYTLFQKSLSLILTWFGLKNRLCWLLVCLGKW